MSVFRNIITASFRKVITATIFVHIYERACGFQRCQNPGVNEAHDTYKVHSAVRFGSLVRSFGALVILLERKRERSLTAEFNP